MPPDGRSKPECCSKNRAAQREVLHGSAAVSAEVQVAIAERQVRQTQVVPKTDVGLPGQWYASAADIEIERHKELAVGYVDAASQAGNDIDIIRAERQRPLASQRQRAVRQPNV